MKRIILVLMTALLWFGCKPGIPADVIKPDKMQKVLYDIHIADGYISTLAYQDSIKKVAASYYDGIYKKFDIDSASYNRSMDYYYAHPEFLSTIYKNIAKSLNLQTKAIQRVDSIANAKIVNAQNLITERKNDSVLVNKGYDLDHAKNGLYLARYKNIYSKNAILFNLLKIKKEAKIDSVKPKVKPKLLTDSFKVEKRKIKQTIKTKHKKKTSKAAKIK